MTPLVVANWKMNPQSATEAQWLFSMVAKNTKAIHGADIVVCPPFVWLTTVREYLRKEKLRVSLGAQDMFWELDGAFTGEVSPSMIQELGCSYVIIGHSERRLHLHETNEMVRRKIQSALKAGLKPILCVGEQNREGTWTAFVAEQIKRALEGVSAKALARLTIAYEPVWAIGTGITDSPEDAMSSSIFIRKLVARRFGRKKADSIRILYGGSVNDENVGSFVSQEGIQGVLVGHASLDPQRFAKIAAIAASSFDSRR